MANTRFVNGGETYVINVGDNIINCNSTAGAIILKLPPITSAGFNWNLSINDTSETSATNNITLQCGANDKINGASTFAISQNGAAALVFVNGLNDYGITGVVDGGAADIGGSGTANYFPKFNSSNVIGNSSNYISGNAIVDAYGKIENNILNSQSGTVTGLITHYIVVFTTTGTYNLPAIATATIGRVYKIFAATGVTVTIAPSEAEKINDVASSISVPANTMVTIRAIDSTNWRIGD